MENGDGFREFSRELILRFERFSREQIGRLDRLTEELRAGNDLAREESRRYFEALDARLSDLHAESQAHTNALLAVLDRLDGPAPAS